MPLLLDSHRCVERIAVVRLVADQVLRLCCNYEEVERQLHERDLMMVDSVRSHRKWRTVTIGNRHDFHAFSALRWPDRIAATPSTGWRCIDIALGLIGGSIFTESVRQLGERRAAQFGLAPPTDGAN